MMQQTAKLGAVWEFGLQYEYHEFVGRDVSAQTYLMLNLVCCESPVDNHLKHNNTNSCSDMSQNSLGGGQAIQYNLPTAKLERL